MQQAQQIAAEIGHELDLPEPSWKYSWIAKVFTWHTAKPTQQALGKFRWTLERHLEKLCFD